MSEELELPDTSPRDARIAAVRLLSRREHSSQEVTQKLNRKGFDDALIEQITQDLRDEGLLSDERFAESYTRSRISGGYGPLRIRQELRQRGVSDEIIATTIINDETQWFELARKVREKRFGDEKPKNLKEKLKQQKFLQYRGFSQQYMKYAFSEDPELAY
jgi:regulatory protein